MPGLETAARFLQKMMASELNAIVEFEEDQRLAYALEEVCRRWASFWSLARQVEDDGQTGVSGLKQQPIKTRSGSVSAIRSRLIP